MIKSFADKDTEILFEGGSPRRFRSFKLQAQRKLEILDVARNLDDLRCPPGNRLEKLYGNRESRFSIRINVQWRVCFEWRDGHVWNVEIVDYH